MTDTNTYILDSIKNWVWSGFYSQDDVQDMIGDILEDDCDERMLRASVAQEFARKAEAERSWPATTDCDRLDSVFEALDRRGVIALQNAGYTQSDGYEDVREQYDGHPGKKDIVGYCFYHGQDLERAVQGAGLYLAFGPMDADREKEDGPLVGAAIQEELGRAGFKVQWNGKFNQRIFIPELDWKRR